MSKIARKTYFSSVPRRSVSTMTFSSDQVPHVTIIRPIKGLEPYLYECLASSIRQDYPHDKLTLHLCVATASDPAFPTLKKLVEDFPDFDVRIFVEDEVVDDNLGPNPKIRNMSQAYKEAKGDIVWIVDCNVWVAKGVCGRMIDKLCGFSPQGQTNRKYKFVHHLPLVVDVDGGTVAKDEETQELLNIHSGTADVDADADPDPDTETDTGADVSLSSSSQKRRRSWASILANGGGRLEELFLSSAHAKMYCAINTVLIAPCTVGKSSMFRRSHLDYLTSPAASPPPRLHPRRPGIDFFSDNICEDLLIGDRLWKGKVIEEQEGERWGKHSLVFGDLAIQPISGMSVSAYIHRRVRWLRVRKFAVLLATLVEPGTESLLCSLYLAFGLTTILPDILPQYCSLFSNWATFFSIWFISILVWIVVDWYVYIRLHSASTIEVDEHTPPFTRPHRNDAISRRPFKEWFSAWLGREVLALPIWLWAIYGGSKIVWRDRAFNVGMDMIAREIVTNNDDEQLPPTRRFPERSMTGTALSPASFSNDGSSIRQRSPSSNSCRVRNKVRLD